MSEIKLSQEQIEALQNCKTKEEVAKFAKDNQLTDEELEKVVGGMMIAAGAKAMFVLAGANGEKEKDGVSHFTPVYPS